MTTSQRSTITSVVTLVSIGTICWVAAGVIALAMGSEAKIIWTCLVGAALGATGIRYSVRRNKKSAI
jgi:CHASE2 domain-containing sensor protein